MSIDPRHAMGTHDSTTSAQTLDTMVVDGTTIQYSDSGGRGDTVLLVHGGMFSAWFEPLAARLDRTGLRVVRLSSSRAHGPSSSSSAVVAAVDRRPCRPRRRGARCRRCATRPRRRHSSGSVISLPLAMDHPALVRSLVLCEAPLADALADPADLEFLYAVVSPGDRRRRGRRRGR